MAGVHSRFGPSSLSTIMACAGWLHLKEKSPPEPESPESIEGTVAHHVAEQLALGVAMKEGDKYMDVEVDDDMIAGAELWVDTVGTDGALEIPVLCQDIHPDCWGTPDFWMWSPETRVLCVWDYKYGHRYVEEFENIQMIAYASGLIRMLGIPDDAVVQLGIVQPRCYMADPVRKWTTTVTKVMELAVEAGKAVTRALDIANAYCRTGSHCIDCDVRAHCKTLQQSTNRAIAFIGKAELHEPTPAALGTELSLLKAAEQLVEARRKALEVMADSLIRSGMRVPGWELKPGQTRLSWNDPVAAITMADMNGVDLRKEAKPITPTQALSKKLVDQQFIDVLASRPPAALKLASVSPVSLRKAFSK
jgi:hypothetical protein